MQRQVETDSRDPKRRDPRQVEFHHPRSVVQEVLQVAERSLKRHHLDEHTPATKYDLRHIRVMEGELRRKGQTDEEERNGGVHFGDVSERDRDPFGAGATRVRASTRYHGPDDREQREGTQL